jgi:sirohydrochlorin ferrochelatase
MLVEGCFLELASPDIAAGCAQLYEQGARDVTVVPLLLFSAGHAKRDIPEQVAAAQARLPGFNIRQAECLNCAAPLVELSALRYRQALATRAEVSSEKSLLLFVGRGSKDAEANAEMRRFAQLRQEQTPVGGVEVCFLAMAQPALAESLAAIAELRWVRIVVQPHLLFAGKLADRIAMQVAEAAKSQQDKDFVLVEPLGAEDLLVQAVLLRAGAVHGAAV